MIAPMLYTALGGPVLGFVYKAVNTMDSMVGYKNDKYLYFGRAAAKLDDVINFIPARISAYLMIAAAYIAFTSATEETMQARIRRRQNRYVQVRLVSNWQVMRVILEKSLRNRILEMHIVLWKEKILCE